MSAPAPSIRKFGFRRWYERQLIESHAWLAACFLSIVMVAAGLELLTLERGFADFAFDALLIGASLVIGWHAWRRYARIMVVAEFIGEQANCPACAHYGFRCEVSDPVAPGGLSMAAFGARCPKCGHRWRIAQAPETGARMAPR